MEAKMKYSKKERVFNPFKSFGEDENTGIGKVKVGSEVVKSSSMRVVTTGARLE